MRQSYTVILSRLKFNFFSRLFTRRTNSQALTLMMRAVLFLPCMPHPRQRRPRELVATDSGANRMPFD